MSLLLGIIIAIEWSDDDDANMYSIIKEKYDMTTLIVADGFSRWRMLEKIMLYIYKLSSYCWSEKIS